MKYANLIKKLNNQTVSILPDMHKAILENAESLVAGGFDITELFDDVKPVYEEFGNVAVINIEGVIYPTATKFEKLLGAVSCKEIRGAIKKAKASKVQNVILNINSPGGVVQGVPETAQAIRDLGKIKETYAYCDDTMASAAYWLGAQANSILVSPSAIVGSIGVYLAILTMEKNLAMQGIEATVLKAGKYKTLGIACKDLTDEEKAYLQAGVDETYQQFKAAVSHRNLSEDAMQGEVYESEKAKALGLIDAFQDGVEDLIEYLKFDKEPNT